MGAEVSGTNTAALDEGAEGSEADEAALVDGPETPEVGASWETKPETGNSSL